MTCRGQSCDMSSLDSHHLVSLVLVSSSYVTTVTHFDTFNTYKDGAQYISLIYVWNIFWINTNLYNYNYILMFALNNICEENIFYFSQANHFVLKNKLHMYTKLFVHDLVRTCSINSNKCFHDQCECLHLAWQDIFRVAIYKKWRG